MTEMILEQLRQLAGTLTVLKSRVREAVAGEVGKAVAESVAEVLTAALGGGLIRYGRYPGSRATTYGRPDWEDLEGHGWHEPQRSARHFDEDLDDDFPTLSPETAFALAWMVGRWWLGRKGSPWSAAGMGLLTGAAFLAGGPIAHTSLAVLWAVHRLLAVSDALGDGAKAFGRV